MAHERRTAKPPPERDPETAVCPLAFGEIGYQVSSENETHLGRCGEARMFGVYPVGLREPPPQAREPPCPEWKARSGHVFFHSRNELEKSDYFFFFAADEGVSRSSAR